MALFVYVLKQMNYNILNILQLMSNQMYQININYYVYIERA